MHWYASTHKVHSVARCILTHSHSYAFKRILMHSLTHAFRESADLPRGWLSSKTRACSLVYAFSRIRMHTYAFICIHMCIRIHSYAFLCILMPAACSLECNAFACIQMRSYASSSECIHTIMHLNVSRAPNA